MDTVARSLNREVPLDELLQLIVESCVDTVPGVDEAGISLLRRNGRIETVAATAQVVRDLDAVQYEVGEGPCHDAIRGDGMRCVDDLAHDDQWPAYAPRAVELGIHSQLGLQLYVEDTTLGGLNLYAFQPNAFDEMTPRVAGLFATHAAHALGRRITHDQLSEAMDSRKIIGQALGIVMERYHLDEDRAFAFLTRVSQTGNVKIRTLAAQLVEDLNQGRRTTLA